MGKIISIVNHFSNNPNKFPLPLTIGVLFSFFSKLLMIHSFDNNSKDYIAKQIKVHPFFVPSYQSGCANYSFEECIYIVSLLKEYDLRFKGVGGGSSENLLKDLILNIIYN